MVLSSDLTKIFLSCVQRFLNKNSFLALLSIWIRFWVRLSVMPITVSFNFFLFLNTISNVISGKLDDDRPWLLALFKSTYPMTSIYINIYVSFSCKGSFKVSVSTTLVSSFLFAFTLCTKIQFLRECRSCLSITLFKSLIFLSIFLVFSSSSLIFTSFLLLYLSNSSNFSLQNPIDLTRFLSWHSPLI